MKHCSYCGAEYTDEVTECPIDQRPMIEQSASSASSPGKHKRDEYDIPPLPAAAKGKEWVMILSPHSSFEADLVFGRLQVAGIRVRFDDVVMGGGLYGTRMRVIQVRVEDYNAAKELLNGA